MLLLTLSLAAILLFMVGCGGESGNTPAGTTSSTTTAQSNTTPATPTSATESESSQLTTLTISNATGESVKVRSEIADTDAKREKGLMGRTALAEDAGMLFVFDQEQRPAFWMKDTLIPLSIAYINARGSIVDIQDMQPLDETPHPPAEPAKYALEVNQGFFRNNSVEVGNKVQLPSQATSANQTSSAEVVQAFKNAGLEVGESYPVEEEPGWSQNQVPKTYLGATRFEIPSLGAGAGGRVFVFSSESNLTALRDYYEGLESSIRPYVYIQDRVLLQISNGLPKDEADRYGEVLKETAS